jgi:nucleotide-binding universal stress UspA family protein
MYRSVIVPLDHSAASEHVLAVAAEIAHSSDATLRLVRQPQREQIRMLGREVAFDGALPAGGDPFPPAPMPIEPIRERLAAHSGMSIDADMPYDGAGSRRIRISNTDLVVLATRDQTGLPRFRVGDISAALVDWQPAPVLALHPAGAAPQREAWPAFRRMLIPLDCSALAEQILVPAVALGSVAGAEYTLLHVIETNMFGDEALVHARDAAQGYLDGVALLMRAEGLRVQTQVAIARDACTAIQQAVCQHAIDVIAMMTHSRGDLDRLLLGSVAAQTLRDNDLPVLLYRPQRVGRE